MIDLSSWNFAFWPDQDIGSRNPATVLTFPNNQPIYLGKSPLHIPRTTISTKYKLLDYHQQEPTATDFCIIYQFANTIQSLICIQSLLHNYTEMWHLLKMSQGQYRRHSFWKVIRSSSLHSFSSQLWRLYFKPITQPQFHCPETTPQICNICI